MVYSQPRNIFVKRDVKLTEPPDAEPHVRWCERSAAKAVSYSIDDVFIFITYHKEESQDEKNYVDGKPDYADAFEDDLIFKWDSQIGKGLDSSYMKDVLEAERKHLLVKKSDAETSFYYMGQFTVVEARNTRKEDNRGRMQPITKVTMKMQHPVREDLLRYLQSNITA